MKIAICDDNKEIIMFYADVLLKICKKNNIKLEIDPYISGKQLLFEWEDVSTHPDIIYLDIGMQGIDGLDTARKMREEGYNGEIIFLTSSKIADTILRAFDVEAFHYVVKEDTKPERFEEIFLNAYKKCQKKSKETIVFSCAGEVRKVFVEDIKYFEAMNHCIVVHYAGGSFEFYSTFGKVENMMQGHGFLRTHRSFIVAMEKAMQISKNQIKLLSGETIPVGRTYMKEVKAEWENLKAGRKVNDTSLTQKKV